MRALHTKALNAAWKAIDALGGVATTDDDKRYVATLNLITGYIDSLWLDSQLAPTDQQLKDYRESFLLPPLDITQEDRDRSYEQNSGWDTQAFCRERQLLSALRTIAEKDARIAEVIEERRLALNKVAGLECQVDFAAGKQ